MTTQTDTPHQPARAPLPARGRRDAAPHDAAGRRAAEALSHRRAQSRGPRALPQRPAPTSSTSACVEPARSRGRASTARAPAAAASTSGASMRRPSGARSGCRTSSCAPPCTGGPDDPAWSDRQRLLVRLADELHDTATVSDVAVGEARGHWDAAQLIELLATVGLLPPGLVHGERRRRRARGRTPSGSRPRGPVPERIALWHATPAARPARRACRPAGRQHGRDGPGDRGGAAPTPGASSTCREATSRCARTGRGTPRLSCCCTASPARSAGGTR